MRYDMAGRVNTPRDQTIRNVPANRFDGYCGFGILQQLRGTLALDWTQGRRAEFESHYHIREFADRDFEYY